MSTIAIAFGIVIVPFIAYRIFQEIRELCRPLTRDEEFIRRRVEQLSNEN